MRTRKQVWAEDAFHRVQARNREDQGFREEYRRQALGFAALVRSAGLAQALAFVESRGGKGQKALLEDLAQTLGYGSLAALRKEAHGAELPAYLLLTRQVLEAAEWYKRFAQSVLEVEG